MAVLTHEQRSACAATKAAAPAAPGRSFWARVFDSIVAARMRRAEDTLHIRGDLIADLRARHGFGNRLRNRGSGTP